MGAVTTTFIAGVEAIKQGMAKPIGSITQLNTIRLGKRTDNNTPKIKDFVPLAKIEDLEFGGWDIFEENCYEAALHAGVLDKPLVESLRAPLEKIKPMPAVFDSNYVKRINGPNLKPKGSKMDHAEMLMDDIRNFKQRTDASRLAMIWCGSTEVFHRPAAVHQTLKDFECGLQKNDPEISPSQIYAYAALKMGVPYANGAPHLTTDTPALMQMARDMNVPIAGKDFKTGQTFMKTLIAPGLKSRMLGVARLVFDQHSRQSRWRSAGRSRDRSSRRKSQSSRRSNRFCSRIFIRNCTSTFTIRSASNTIRRAATRKKAGTTSTSSDGSAIRCRSRSTSSAAIRFLRRRWCSTSCSSWILRSAPECGACRNGFRSFSKRR